MSQSKIDKTLPKKILDSAIREAVVSAIRQEHTDISSAIKNIAAVTDINASAIAKWHTGKNTPSTVHFLTLATYYPGILQLLLTLIGREDLWQIVVDKNIPNDMQTRLSVIQSQYKKRGDISVQGTAQKYAFSFNERQLWFLEMLRRAEKMQNKDIVSHWNVTLRTAKRDTEKLIADGFVCSVRAGGTDWFEWTGKAYAQ